MNFKSKPEAYVYSLLLLYRIKARNVQAGYPTASLDQCITNIKIAFENHEQDPAVVCQLLNPLVSEKKISKQDKDLVQQLRHDLESSEYIQTAEEKFRNPLARRAESELTIALLQNPTPAMMKSVKRVSDKLLAIIEDQKERFGFFTNIFMEDYHVIALGSFKNNPSAQQIIGCLKNNDPATLAEIMHIHFKFMQQITKDIPIKCAAVRKPTGKLAEIVRNIWAGTPESFFSEGLQVRENVTFISDRYMYGSDLYRKDNRGRKGGIVPTRTSQLGLMLNDQKEDEVNLPTHESSWVADCKSQAPNMESPYVLDAIENDTVYVSGPSGITSMLLGQMEILANFENVDFKKHYLAAIVAYIVGGGFHSIHEVIGPAQHALELVPGYKVQVPDSDNQAPPPNYHQFFAQQEAIDPAFKERHDKAWEKILHYFNDVYAPRCIEGFKHEKLHFNLKKLNKSSPTSLESLNQSIKKIINSYIQNGALSRGNRDNKLSFISRFFRNNKLTQAKLDIAIGFRDSINSERNVESLRNDLALLRQNNIELEKTHHKTYGFLTKSGLVRALDNIESLIDGYELQQTLAY